MGIYTNCALEGYHGRVNREMGAVHPTLEHFAESLFQIDCNIVAKTEMRRRTTDSSFDDAAMSNKIEQFQKNWENISTIMDKLTYCSPKKTKAESKEQSTAAKQEEAQDSQYADCKLTEDDNEKIELLQGLNSELTSDWGKEES